MITHLSKQFNIAPVVVQKILCCVLNCTLPQLLVKNTALSQKEMDCFKSAVLKHKNGMPVEYIMQTCGFYGLDFFVNENVLIPRVETELLVERAVGYLVENFANGKCKIVDLCTGSGIIAISVARECEKHNIEAEIFAVDVLPFALEVCQKNVEIHNVKVDVLEMDILKDDLPYNFDVIISNPPYIETKTIDGLANSVKNFEPHLALNGGEDGLVFYKHFKKMFKSGVLFLEIGYNQGNAMREIFENCEIVKDFNNNDRICKVNFNLA